MNSSQSTTAAAQVALAPETLRTPSVRKMQEPASVTERPKVLSKSDALALLQRCEGEIAEGNKKVGTALCYIKDKSLWKADAEYESFDDYCHRKWNFTERTANRLIMDVRVVSDMKDAGITNLPVNAKQSALLFDLKPEQQKAVAEKIDFSKTKVSEVRKAVLEIAPHKASKKAETRVVRPSYWISAEALIEKIDEAPVKTMKEALALIASIKRELNKHVRKAA
jgi:hypothetical protein